MMDMLRTWGSNPANPKNVQVSFMVVIGMIELLKKLDTNSLTNEEIKAYKFIHEELETKKGKIATRQAYTAVVLASDAKEKESAYINYQETKAIYSKQRRG